MKTEIRSFRRGPRRLVALGRMMAVASAVMVLLSSALQVQAQDAAADDATAPPSADDVAATVPPAAEQTKSLLDVYKSGGPMMHILALMFIWNLRFSRSIWIHLVVKYDRNAKKKVEK